MSHKGYLLEHELETYFLKLTGQTIQDPILDARGVIQRTFRVPSSGAMSSMKGDVRTAVPFLPKQWLIEAKHRRSKSKQGSRTTPIYHLDIRLVQKNVDEAEAIGFVPVFVFAFKGSPKNRLQAIFRESDFMNLVYNVNLKFVVKVAPIQFRQNKTTLTIRKNELDKTKGTPVVFIHKGLSYVLISWDLVDLILLSFKGSS